MGKGYKCKCPNCGKIVYSSFDLAPVLTTICLKCDYCILEDEVDWKEVLNG